MDAKTNNKLFQIGDEADKGEILALLKTLCASQHDMLLQAAESEQRQENMQQQINSIIGAFPEGNLSAHCEYHQRLIDAVIAHNALLDDIRVTVIKRGVIGAIYGILMLAAMGGIALVSTIMHKGFFASISELFK